MSKPAPIADSKPTVSEILATIPTADLRAMYDELDAIIAERRAST